MLEDYKLTENISKVQLCCSR